MQRKTLKEISTMTERNYRTVKKYIEKEDINEDNHKAKKVSKSDVLKPIIQKWIQEDLDRHRKQRHTAELKIGVAAIVFFTSKNCILILPKTTSSGIEECCRLCRNLGLL